MKKTINGRVWQLKWVRDRRGNRWLYADTMFVGAVLTHPTVFTKTDGVHWAAFVGARRRLGNVSVRSKTTAGALFLAKKNCLRSVIALLDLGLL